MEVYRYGYLFLRSDIQEDQVWPKGTCTFSEVGISGARSNLDDSRKGKHTTKVFGEHHA